MKIAIIAPSPVPFTVGGAENLCWGLLRSINQATPHHAELIKLPSPEGDFWSLIESYRRFSELNVSHFDMVISTKYPSWMIHHHHHVCYLLHRLRGLYDTYHTTGLPLHYRPRHPSLVAIQNFIKTSHGRRESLREFFDLLECLRRDPSVPKDAFTFPGPFIREVIHFLDGIGLSSRNVSRYTAISHNVAKRKDYFPADVKVAVIYPPSHLPWFRSGSMDYLFTVSRLDKPKRIQLLLEAMRHVKSPVELRIAGTGPEEHTLKALAKGDPRIIFLGFVNDAELIDLYADALAVLFVPHDEDYGLITIEAMKSGKPVITTTDSGGPAEFVKDKETGFSVPPEPKALARQIDYLCRHREEARLLGQQAHTSVREISWENAVSQLVGNSMQPLPSIKKERRRKICVASTFPVYPPRGGGQSRIYNLYRHLAHELDVDIVAFTSADSKTGRSEIAPNLWEVRIPKSTAHQKAEWVLEQKAGGVPITDVAMPQLQHLSPDYVEALRESARSADYIIASHPYLLPAIRETCDKPLWYEAHNVESELKKKILPATTTGQGLLEATRNVEADSCRLSALIMTCSADDGEMLHRLYGADRTKLIEVPNGVDLNAVRYTPPDRRLAYKRELGVGSSFIALFMGSWHGPNLEAVRNIVGFTEGLPDIMFLIMGSAALAFKDRPHPSNVGFLGEVDDITKAIILGISDVALNPMETGSGTNLKMLEYCAAGIPVISTPHGARGLMLKHGSHLEIAACDRFPDAIRLLGQARKTLEQRVERARDCVVSHYDWALIAQNFIKGLKKKGLL